jgi:sarcosine oxidase subunit delta
MLRIPCPYCGSVRDEDEFTFGGPYARTRPAASQQLDDAQWADYLFTRANARGASLERWRHTYGCRRWFGIERDTVTHDLARVFTFHMLPRAASTAGDTGDTMYDAC